MFHPWARRIVSRSLASGLGQAELGALGAVTLHGGEEISGEVLSGWLEQALAAPADPPPPGHSPLYQQPIPATARDLLAQVLPVITNQPGDQGLSLGLIGGIARLWPHVGSDERAQLRTRLLDALLAGAARWQGHGAILTREDLRSWNRQVPTLDFDEVPEAATLAGLPTATSARDAFFMIAGHLGHQPGPLAHILGSLAAQTAVIGDDDGLAAHAMIGAAWIADIGGQAPGDVMATLLAQLAHQIWWAAQHPRQPTTQRVTAGRSARHASANATAWWAEVARQGNAASHAALIAAVALRARARGLSPDDAATVAAALSE